MIQVKRIYEPSKKSDGIRILVDRLWPRGVSKKDAAIDLWLKEIAPSTTLRTWFNHEDDKWLSFKTKYAQEIEQKLQLLKPIIQYFEDIHGTITLVYGAKNELHNNAVALQEYLD